jgi:hypothetical protein
MEFGEWPDPAFADEGYGGPTNDYAEILPLLVFIHQHLLNPSQLSSQEAMEEGLIDGLGYIYFCVRHWQNSTLLQAITPNLNGTIPLSTNANTMVDRFWEEAEHDVDAFAWRYAGEVTNNL